MSQCSLEDGCVGICQMFGKAVTNITYLYSFCLFKKGKKTYQILKCNEQLLFSRGEFSLHVYLYSLSKYH